MTPAEIIARQPAAARPIDEIIVHCTATGHRVAVTVDEIRQWHRARGWDDIGYHYVVLLDGSLEPGRPEAKIGAHVEGHNQRTLGVVYVGGIGADGRPADTRTAAQTRALLDTVGALIAKYPAVAKVSGHNEYAAKACPSFDVRRDPLSALVRRPPAFLQEAAPITNPVHPDSGIARAFRKILAALGR